ncbi:MAG: glycerol-3-phosphate acyltransferase [Chloroflexota bacterium]
MDKVTINNSLIAFILAYLIGSFPTAVITSRIAQGKDIREMGDGNMGGLNVTRIMGLKCGVFVALFDISKGILTISISQRLGLSLSEQIITGAFTVMGHDFPVWAGFKGGQGFAAITGVLFMLAPLPVTVGMLLFLIIILIYRKFEPSAAIGAASTVALIIILEHAYLVAGFAALVFVTIPLKKALDLPRRKMILAKQSTEEENNNHLSAPDNGLG